MVPETALIVLEYPFSVRIARHAECFVPRFLAPDRDRDRQVERWVILGVRPAILLAACALRPAKTSARWLIAAFACAFRNF
jgi:hypothetical protein